MLRLDIAISTYKPEGILRVERMLESIKPASGVKFIISWQEHENADIPQFISDRRDTDVYRLDKSGLSNNRNNAMAHCSGDIILISDDDMEYEENFARKILDAFEKNPQMDLGLFKINFPKEKTYPLEECEIKVPFPKNYYVASVEIAFRRRQLKDLLFCEEMGLGNKKLECGEDEFFVVSAIKRGKKVRFINEIIGRHPEETTGGKLSKGILRAQGFMTGVIYPWTMILRVLLKAYRLRKDNKGGFIKNSYFLIWGAIYSKVRLKYLPKSCRW